eukprot:Blabericola_migrator_1__5301@NODE_271_length_10510_cov_106_175333_g226_i0_p1_GENE_NODE_271_length_10510_cov_106_175333_g226_i0NODE_271_length_10510_cov_106_175333_g226_i0_p1_ORF_typecomplete_len1817_score198_97_NODE_271_length_10510_cov_106_175333_g226_i0502110471
MVTPPESQQVRRGLEELRHDHMQASSSKHAKHSILSLLTAAQSALSKTCEVNRPNTEPPRLYVSQRDWWLRQIESNSRDCFRHSQWQLSVAKSLAEGVKLHWSCRRLQEPNWKASTIASATADFWHTQESKIDWPSHVSEFSATLPQIRVPIHRVPEASSLPPNKRPRVTDAVSPTETQRRSKRRRRASSTGSPTVSAPSLPPTPAGTWQPTNVSNTVDSDALLFGRRRQPTFWPATCSDDGALVCSDSSGLEDYCFRLLQSMTRYQSREESKPPVQARRKREGAGGSEVQSSVPGAKSTDAPPVKRRSRNVRIRCRLSSWRPFEINRTRTSQPLVPVLRIRDPSSYAMLTSLGGARKNRSRDVKARVFDQVSPKDVDLAGHGARREVEVIGMFRINKGGVLPGGLQPVPVEPLTTFAHLTLDEAGGTVLEARQYSSNTVKGNLTLCMAYEERLDDVQTMASLMLSNSWEVSCALRALCRLQKLMAITELTLSSAAHAEAVQLTSQKSTDNNPTDSTPIEVSMKPTIHGFQEYVAHLLFRSSSPQDWLKRFQSNLKNFVPIDQSQVMGVWQDTTSEVDVSRATVLALPLESILFLSRRHSRDKKKSMQQTTSRPSSTALGHRPFEETSVNSTNFKLEHALMQSGSQVSKDDLRMSDEAASVGNLSVGPTIRASIFRKTVGVVNRLPPWAVALRLSAWSKLPDTLWEVTPSLLGAVTTLGGPIFDPQAKIAANAPVLRFKRDDPALSQLLTLLNRSITIFDPVILYSRMTRQTPSAKADLDPSFFVSNLFCLPVPAAVKGPSRVIRRLEFGWNPAEEVALWRAVMSQVRNEIKDEMFSRHGVVSLTTFWDLWRRSGKTTVPHDTDSTGSAQNTATFGEQCALVAPIVAVNWSLVADEVNSVLKPFDRARSAALCEAKYLSLMSEIVTAAFTHPVAEYKLASSAITPSLTTSAEKLPSPPLSAEADPVTADKLPLWEQSTLQHLDKVACVASVDSLPGSQLRDAKAETFEFDIVGVSNFEDQELPTEAVLMPESREIARAIWQCKHSCSAESVRQRVDEDLVFGSSHVWSFEVVFDSIARAWCSKCLGEYSEESAIEALVQDPDLSTALLAYTKSPQRSAMQACQAKIDEAAGIPLWETTTDGTFRLIAVSSAASALLSEVRDGLRELSVSEAVELNARLTGATMISALENVQNEIFFRKTLDFQQSGGLLSPAIVQLLNEDRSALLSKELVDWSGLFSCGSYRFVSARDPTAAEPRPDRLRKAALTEARQRQLSQLTEWLCHVTAAEQLERLTVHLASFHTNSAKRRKSLMSQEGQVENYYLDHHLRAHVHTSPACLSILQAMRNVMSREQSADAFPRPDTPHREIAPPAVFHQTCVNYNRVIFPPHPSQDKIRAECEGKLTPLSIAFSLLTLADHLFNRSETSISLVKSLPPVMTEPMVASALLCRVASVVPSAYIEKPPPRDLLQNLLFGVLCTWGSVPPDLLQQQWQRSPTKTDVRLALNLEEAHRSMMSAYLSHPESQKSSTTKSRKTWQPQQPDSPVRGPSRLDANSRSRSTTSAQHPQQYPQMAPYRPAPLSQQALQRPQVMDYKHVPPMQIPQTWNHVLNYDQAMRAHQMPHYTVLPSADQNLNAHMPVQQPYSLPMSYHRQADPWRRPPAGKVSLEQVTSRAPQRTHIGQTRAPQGPSYSSSGGGMSVPETSPMNTSMSAHQSWYNPAPVQQHDRFTQPTYIEFRPNQQSASATTPMYSAMSSHQYQPDYSSQYYHPAAVAAQYSTAGQQGSNNAYMYGNGIYGPTPPGMYSQQVASMPPDDTSQNKTY